MSNSSRQVDPANKSLATLLAQAPAPSGIGTYANVLQQQETNDPAEGDPAAAVDYVTRTTAERARIMADAFLSYHDIFEGTRQAGALDIKNDLRVGGNVTSNLLALAASQDIGNATTRRWGTIFATDLNLTGQIISAADRKDSVRFATDVTLPAATLVGNVLTADANGAFPVVDGVTGVVADRMLNKDYAASDPRHGLYTVTDLGDGSNPWILTRSTDADTDAKVTGGMTVPVNEGTVNEDTQWQLRTDDPITLNTTALEFGFGGVTAHASLTGLGADDHTQYHTDARGDVRYFQKSEHITTSVGAGDSGKPIALDGGGQVDASMLNDADIDHGLIGGLGDDDHPQYADGSIAWTGAPVPDSDGGQDFGVTGTRWGTGFLGDLVLGGAVIANAPAGAVDLVIGSGDAVNRGVAIFVGAAQIGSFKVTDTSGVEVGSWEYSTSTNVWTSRNSGIAELQLGPTEIRPASDGGQGLGLVNRNFTNLFLNGHVDLGERASSVNPAAGDLRIWTRNDNPNTAMATDDAGFDHPLSLMETVLLQPLDATFPGTGGATLGSDPTSAVPHLAFADTLTETAFINIEIPRTYSGNGLTVRITWSDDSGAGGNGRFTTAFERHEAGHDINATALGTVITQNNAGNGTIGVLNISDHPHTNAELNGLLAGERGRIRLQREGGNAADTLNGGTVHFAHVELIENP